MYLISKGTGHNNDYLYLVKAKGEPKYTRILGEALPFNEYEAALAKAKEVWAVETPEKLVYIHLWKPEMGMLTKIVKTI